MYMFLPGKDAKIPPGWWAPAKGPGCCIGCRLPNRLPYLVRLIWSLSPNFDRSSTHSSDPRPAKDGGLVVLGRVDGQLLVVVVRLSPPNGDTLRVAWGVLYEPLD